MADGQYHGMWCSTKKCVLSDLVQLNTIEYQIHTHTNVSEITKQLVNMTMTWEWIVK